LYVSMGVDPDGSVARDVYGIAMPVPAPVCIKGNTRHPAVATA